MITTKIGKYRSFYICTLKSLGNYSDRGCFQKNFPIFSFLNLSKILCKITALGVVKLTDYNPVTLAFFDFSIDYYAQSSDSCGIFQRILQKYLPLNLQLLFSRQYQLLRLHLIYRKGCYKNLQQ